MVVVLCQNYQEAQDSFRAWLGFLQMYEDDHLKSSLNADKYSLRIRDYDGENYIFIDHRFKNLFNREDVSFVTFEEFFGFDPLQKEWKSIVEE